MVEVKLDISQEVCNWLWDYMIMAQADGHPEATIIMEQLPLPKWKKRVEDGEEESS